MRGKVLGVNQETGEGVISGDDGRRYPFAATDVQSGTHAVIPGKEVDFEVVDNRASAIFTIVSKGADKNKLTAGLLAFFLGSFGVHKFYLGKKTAGFIMLGVWFGGLILFAIPSLVIGVIAFIEAIIYWSMDEQKFYDTYVAGDREWL